MPLGTITTLLRPDHGYRVGLSIIHLPQMFTSPPAGFGLGALNDADEDDVDIYDHGPSSRRNLTAFEAGDENRHRALVSGKDTPGSRASAPNVGPLRLTLEIDHYSPPHSPKTLLFNFSEMGNLFCQNSYSWTFHW